MGPERHVSAVIFELVGNLYPANARGLLQAISKTENYRLTKNTSLDVAFNVLSQINPEEKTNLEDETIHSYGWDDYEQYYEHFCRLAQNFRRGEYTVKTFMGDVNKDWNPLGFSRIDTETTRPTVSDKECEIKKWSSAVSNYKTVFGARTFLIRNYEIISIKNRYLIDFEDPDHQFIPDIWNDRRH